MTVRAAFVDGWRRVGRAPLLIIVLWLMTVALVLPLALILRDAIATHLGDSRAAEMAASGVNFEWWGEFLAQASGLSQTFGPSILGFAAVLRNLSDLADGVSLPLGVAIAVGAHLVVTIFVSGGVLDRLARDRRTGSAAFFAACGVYFFRFLRLGVVIGATYLLLFSWFHPWLFDRLYPTWTREVSVERNALALRALLYAVFASAVVAVNLVADYAKFRMVVEDRRSALGAVAAALRFVRRNAAAAVALYLLNTLVFALILLFYFVVAPTAGGGRIADLMAFVVAQIYVVLRVTARLTFAASQIALFQGRLAHAGYTARPAPKWPDSASAEALSN